jgi:hypothetical protein
VFRTHLAAFDGHSTTTHGLVWSGRESWARDVELEGGSVHIQLTVCDEHRRAARLCLAILPVLAHSIVEVVSRSHRDDVVCHSTLLHEQLFTNHVFTVRQSPRRLPQRVAARYILHLLAASARISGLQGALLGLLSESSGSLSAEATWLQETVISVLGSTPGSAEPLMEVSLHSLRAVELRNSLAKAVGIHPLGHPRLAYLCRRNVRLEAHGGAATAVRGISMQQLDATQHHARPRRPVYQQQSGGVAPVQHAASGCSVRALSNNGERAVLRQVDQQLPAGRRRRSTPMSTVANCWCCRVECVLQRRRATAEKLPHAMRLDTTPTHVRGAATEQSPCCTPFAVVQAAPGVGQLGHCLWL